MTHITLHHVCRNPHVSCYTVDARYIRCAIVQIARSIYALPQIVYDAYHTSRAICHELINMNRAPSIMEHIMDDALGIVQRLLRTVCKCVVYHAPCIVYPSPCAMYQVPCVVYRVSYTTCHVVHTMRHVPDNIQHISHVSPYNLHLALRTAHLAHHKGHITFHISPAACSRCCAVHHTYTI